MLSIRTNPHLDGRKVGLIVPSVNTTTEPEFAWIAPPGISFHAARIFMNVTSPDALRAMNAEVRHAARQLATLSPELLAYVCTAGSFVDGVDGARALLDDLRGVVGCPIVATSVVMVEALRRNGNAVGYFLFLGEQHGFRQAANIKRCLDAELTFYAVEVFRIGLTF